MARAAASIPAPPFEVLVEFLHALQQLVNDYDGIVPVLRGSTLLKHWFGDEARPAGDIDLEWFPQPGNELRLAGAADRTRILCMYAVSDYNSSPIVFAEDIPVPSDGVSLWDYGTPGFRCYTGWTWTDRNLRGVLQVDLAQAGSYDLRGISTEAIHLTRASGEQTSFLAYTPEMLLAAKLSWIARTWQRDTTAKGSKLGAFTGEPKDFFDAHLLLTKGHLRPEVFQSALLAVAMEDKLTEDQLDILLDPRLALPDGDWFVRGADYFDRSGKSQSPTEIVETFFAGLRPLAGDVRQHLPFLLAIKADPSDESHLMIYADWLEERGDARGLFVRQFCSFYFRDNREARSILASTLSAQPGGWLYYVFGGPERARDLRRRIEAL